MIKGNIFSASFHTSYALEVKTLTKARKNRMLHGICAILDPTVIQYRDNFLIK